MRGRGELQQVMFIYRSMDERIPDHHPLRTIRGLVDRVLAELGPQSVMRGGMLYSTADFGNVLAPAVVGHFECNSRAGSISSKISSTDQT